MDKRSLFFAIALFVTFYGFQAWFESENRQAQEKAITLAKEQAEIKQKEIEYQLSHRLQPIANLPVRSLYKDSALKEKLFSAVQAGDVYFTFSKLEQLPNNVFVDTGKEVQKIELAIENQKNHTIVAYKKHGATLVKLPAIPGDKVTDLQMVSLGETMRSILGEQRGQLFTVPYQQIEENAICLMEVNGKYLPVGFYDSASKSVKRLDAISDLSEIVQQESSPKVTISATGEKFYVLENASQMLVFSSKGGSIAEINLPIQNAEHPERLVKEIDFDREILKTSPENAQFPLHPYFSIDENGKKFNQTPKIGGYYPLLRRPILAIDGVNQTAFNPKYYALNIEGEDPEIASAEYTVSRFEPNLIEFIGKTKNHKITKTYTIPEERNGPYCFILNLKIEGDTSNLWISSGVPDVEIVGGSYGPLLRFQQTLGKISDVETIELPGKNITLESSLNPNWISNSNGFFGIILDPLDQKTPGYKAAAIDGKELPTRLTLIDAKYDLYPASKYPGYATFIPLENRQEVQFRIFAGPYDLNLLKTLDSLYDEPLSNYNPEYVSAQKIQGWFSFISEPFSKFLTFLIEVFYQVTGSWAFSIVLLTIALRLMMQPFNARSAKVMQEQNEKKKQYASQIQAIKDRYKSDPKKESFETLRFYKEKGIHMTPISGCLPQLLQMPFLFGMFYLLKSFFPLRGAPFISGWIDDLAAPDILFSWSQPLWIIGNELHLLPILMGASMYFQQKMSSAMQADVTLSDEQKQAMKMQSFILPFLFAFLFYDLPSGVSLYFGLSTLLGIAQQKWTLHKAQKRAM